MKRKLSVRSIVLRSIIILLAIIYFFFPFDFIPDVLGIIGYTDDLAVAIIASFFCKLIKE